MKDPFSEPYVVERGNLFFLCGCVLGVQNTYQGGWCTYRVTRISPLVGFLAWLPSIGEL